MNLAEFPGALAFRNSERGRAEVRKGWIGERTADPTLRELSGYGFVYSVWKLECGRQVTAGLRHRPIPAKTNVGPMVNDVEQSFNKCAVWIILEIEIPCRTLQRRCHMRKGFRVGGDMICAGVRIGTSSWVETRWEKMVIGQRKLGTRYKGRSSAPKRGRRTEIWGCRRLDEEEQW